MIVVNLSHYLAGGYFDYFSTPGWANCVGKSEASRFNFRPSRDLYGTLLFYLPGTCSPSPHIALLEAGLPYTLQKVDLKDKKIDSGEDFNNLNGKDYVRALNSTIGSC